MSSKVKEYIEIGKKNLPPVKAIQLLPNYDSIKEVIDFCNATVNIKDTEISTNLLVGKTLEVEHVMASDGTVVSFNEFIMKDENGRFNVMSPSYFYHTYTEFKPADIFHADWLFIPALGGDMYKEYEIEKNIFIIINNDRDRYIVYRDENKTDFSIAKISIPKLICTLCGFIELRLLFLYPDENKCYKLSYKHNEYTCIELDDGFAYNKPVSKVFMTLNDQRLNNYRALLEVEYAEKINQIRECAKENKSVRDDSTEVEDQ